RCNTIIQRESVAELARVPPQPPPRNSGEFRYQELVSVSAQPCFAVRLLPSDYCHSGSDRAVVGPRCVGDARHPEPRPGPVRSSVVSPARPPDGTGGRGRGRTMSAFPPHSRRGRLALLAAVACVLLVLPGLSHSQPPTKQQQIVDLEKQIGDLQKKLEELKRGEVSTSAARPIG